MIPVGRAGAFVDEQQPEACGGPAQQLTQQLSLRQPAEKRKQYSKCLTSCSQPCHIRLVSACGANRGLRCMTSFLLCALVRVSFVCDRTVLRSAARGAREAQHFGLQNGILDS